MKKLFFLICVAVQFSAAAQYKSASLQAAGLTCAMCSNAINKSLSKLNFIAKVDADVSKSSFQITFKEGSAVNIDQIRAKVEDAGFSVARLELTILFDQKKINNDEHITVGGNVLHFVNIKEQLFDGEKKVVLVDKYFVPAKDFKKNVLLTKMECIKTGVAGACCTKDGIDAKARVYHVTI